jgi:outer membrane protein assembly factor BamB
LDFTVAKFDSDGTLLWQQNLNGTANGVDGASSVTVDNQGNALAAGGTQNAGTFFDFTVVKFDRDGSLVWQQNAIEDDADIPVVGELRRENSAFRIVCTSGQSAVRRRSTVAH